MAPIQSKVATPRLSSSQSTQHTSTFWELELRAGGYRSLVPNATALNFHGRALVEESNRNTLNHLLSQIRQNKPFLPPNSRLQLENRPLQLSDYQNTPRSYDSVV